MRAVSSVGSEHLVYTQRVGGSNPSPPTDRVLSSVGSEHLVYTQRVRGSNPLEPTKSKIFISLGFFLCVFLLAILLDIKFMFGVFNRYNIL
jgi:hypothetical protein